MESLIIQVKWQAKGWRAFAAEADAVCVGQSSGGASPPDRICSSLILRVAT
ncbi:hypothetical protein P3W85_32385 [Cupriavidus basilensis]|uniref:Uncharacterized protein n=1 Tax=Cupriavidus basilensis TaxID=68895 RepID=A0ABT6AY98_9BURK|nr:hypothetical protein [Cupriavidus basilensis]MDF3837606.1 hypothetical protein [Cupriavidus basilensis]